MFGGIGKFFQALTEQLVAYARSEFALTALQDDGKPLRDHLLSLWRQERIQPEQLANAPVLPLLGSYLWEYFVGLRNSSQMAKTSRLTTQAIMDWCWVEDVSLSRWERRAINAMDVAWVMEANRGR